MSLVSRYYAFLSGMRGDGACLPRASIAQRSKGLRGEDVLNARHTIGQRKVMENTLLTKDPLRILHLRYGMLYEAE